MTNYTFTTLAPDDFEDLTRDLLQLHLGETLQSFTNGRDGGVDLRHSPIAGRDWIVQCKHFVGSGFAKLRSHLENKELPKVATLSPARYILATSVGLSPGNVDQLFELLQPYCRSKHDILGKDDLNTLLRQHPEVERSHIKLWLTSEPVLSAVLNNDLFVQASLTHEDIKRRLSLYVYTDIFDKARERLDQGRVCILSGVPGVGKTTLAEMLLIEYVMNGWQLTTIHQNVDEGLRAFRLNQNAKQIFYYDDFLGQISSGEKLAKNEDRVLLQLIKSISANPRKRFVLTTREYILAQARAEHEELARSDIDIYQFVVNCEEYGELEKAKILVNHLYFNEVPQDHIAALVDNSQYRRIITHRNYNPRIVEWMTGSTEVSAIPALAYPDIFVERLDNPTRLWKHAFDRQLSESSRQLLLLLASCGDAMFVEELADLFVEYYRQRASSLGIPRSSSDFINSLKELEGNFVRLHRDNNSRIVQFHNPSILDFLRGELRDRSEDVLDLLRTARYFEQPERLALTFELSNTTLASTQAFTDLIAAAIALTIGNKPGAVSKHDRVATWRAKAHDRWDRLKTCLRIGSAYKDAALRDRLQVVIRDHTASLPWWELYHATKFLAITEKEDWYDAKAISEYQQQFKAQLLSRENLDSSLYELSAVASWITEHENTLASDERKRLEGSIVQAVKKEVSDAYSEKSPQSIEFDLRCLGEISIALGTRFQPEEERLNQALTECEPPPADESPNDRRAAADPSGSTSVESLFRSLID